MSEHDDTWDLSAGSDRVGDGELSAPPVPVGRYRIQEALGKGNFGLVYLAYDDQLDRQVAVKVPHPHLIERPEGAEAYLAEARTVASLDHPTIVPVYDVGSSEDFPCFIVSKYVEGMTLAKRMAGARLPIAEAVGIVATVTDALHYAHQRGVVHRDVKPGNILIGTEQSVHVTDFGLARRDGAAGKGLSYAGTPAYMSPEQARRDGQRIGGRSDVFSLGVVLYELLTGTLPFSGSTWRELVDQVLTKNPTPPRDIDRTIPEELQAICLRALSKRVSERSASASEMATDLRRLLERDRREDPVRVPLFREGDDKSIAVLPFVNMSSDPEQEYFVTGSPRTSSMP